ncbi:MAG: indole-3-glycerol phosphate synthase TrpC [Gemmatimonadota bacterium]
MTEAQEKAASAVSPTHILDRIVDTKRREVTELANRRASVVEQARAAPRPRRWMKALGGGSEVAVIAEVKRRSPGAGAIRLDLDPAHLARSYQSGGARALSVLTDREYFHGSSHDLIRARAAVDLPVLRKDFIIDPLQIWEARAMGADAILLIVRILDDASLRELRELAEELGMGVLVEVHDEDEMERALSSGASMVGVNNRDLQTFTTDLATTERLLSLVPPELPVISESGIRSGDEVKRLGKAGVDGILMGETLLRAVEPGQCVKEFVGHARRARTRFGSTP